MADNFWTVAFLFAKGGSDGHGGGNNSRKTYRDADDRNCERIIQDLHDGFQAIERRNLDYKNGQYHEG